MALEDTKFFFHWKNPSQWNHKPEDVAWLILLGVYVVLTGVAIYVFHQYRHRYSYFLVPPFFATLFFRYLFFITKILTREEIIAGPGWIGFLVRTFPTYTFFSCFMVPLVTWSELFITGGETQSGKRKQLRRRLRLFLSIFNLALYTTLAVFIGVNFYLTYTNKDYANDPVAHDPWASTPLGRASMLLIPTLYIVVPIGFVISMYILYKTDLHKNLLYRHQYSPETRKNIRTMSTVALTCTISFIFRAIMVIVLGVDSKAHDLWWFQTCYFGIFEIVPMVLVMFSYVSKKKERSRKTALRALSVNIESLDSSPRESTSPLDTPTIFSPLLGRNKETPYSYYSPATSPRDRDGFLRLDDRAR